MNEIELHLQFSEYGQKAREWTNRCKMLLPEIARLQVWKRRGYSSLYEYAGKLAGMSHHTVDDTLRILRRIEDKPALQKVALEKGLNRVRPIASVATPETQDFWAEKANEMAKTTLETYVREVKYPNRSEDHTNTVLFSLRLKRSTVEKLKRCGELEVLLEQFAATLPEPELEKPKPVQTHSRYIPARIHRYVRQNTNDLCAFPGCTRPYEILHHTQRWALEHIHDPDRLVPLCLAHERLAHHGLIQNEQGPTETWTLRLNPNFNSPEFWVDQHVALFRGG